LEEAMQAGDLVRSRQGLATRDLGLVIDVMPQGLRTAVRTLLNNGKPIWVNAEMLEILNENR
jgi:hypothetical protein